LARESKKPTGQVFFIIPDFRGTVVDFSDALPSENKTFFHFFAVNMNPSHVYYVWTE
jgi:hypothetical protein